MSVNTLDMTTRRVVSSRRRSGRASYTDDEPCLSRPAAARAVYRVVMSRRDDTERDQIFMEWISQQLRDLKDEGVSRTEAAMRGSVSRNQTYEWEGRGQKGFSRPKPETIKTWCVANGRDWRVAFRILGYDTSGRSHEELTGTTGLDRRINLLRTALERPGIDPEERRDLEIELVRLEAVKRTSEDTISSADRVLRRYGHGAA